MDINSVIANIVVTLLIAVIPVVAGYVVRLLVQYIRNSQNQTDDRLAAIAVAWAEDQLTADKLNGAAVKLSELSKGRIKVEDAKVLVAATYQNVLGELAPLKK